MMSGEGDEQPTQHGGSIPRFGFDEHHNTVHFSDFHPPKFESEGETDRCGEAFVLKKSNPFRKVWSVLIMVLLIYIGTVFVYRVAFVMSRIEIDEAAFTKQFEPDAWEIFDRIVCVVFCIDLVANFFSTYDDKGREVCSLWLIATRYLATYFVIDFIACVPESFVRFFISENVGTSTSPGNFNQGVRIMRLQRVSRLARLLRLSRIGHIVKIKPGRVTALERQRGLRLLNLLFGLLWVVHILACGWYLCAAIHEDPMETWVARRDLFVATPLAAWMHCMYFVLMVFTTVGFGDIYAVTVGEIFYVCVTMAIGAVVHSIIVGEVIALVTSNDKTNQYVRNQVELIDAFSDHTELDPSAQEELRAWIAASARFWVSHRFDRQEMRDLLTSKCMPQSLLTRLPQSLFHGKLLRNTFFRVNRNVGNVPPRLPMLAALAAHKSSFEPGDIIYQTQEYPFNLFLVLSGTFAYVATPSQRGGVAYSEATPSRRASLAHVREQIAGAMHATTSSETVAPAAPAMSPYQMFSFGSYFGDIELFRGVQRRATARCEIGGCVLVLKKEDVQQLADEFPNLLNKLVSAAAAREQSRTAKQARLSRGHDIVEFAAGIIMRAVRAHLQRRRSAANPEEELVAPGGCSPKRSKASRVSTIKDQDSNAEVVRSRVDYDAMERKLDHVLSALTLLNSCSVNVKG